MSRTRNRAHIEFRRTRRIIKQARIREARKLLVPILQANPATSLMRGFISPSPVYLKQSLSPELASKVMNMRVRAKNERLKFYERGNKQLYELKHYKKSTVYTQSTAYGQGEWVGLDGKVVTKPTRSGQYE